MSARGIWKDAVMKSNLGRHTADEVLEQYSMGKLPESEAGPLEEHLLVCAECQDRLQQSDAFVAATRAAARKLRAQPPSRRRIPAMMWAAGLAVFLGLLVLAGRPWRFLNSADGPPVVVLLRSVRGAEGLVGSSAPPDKLVVLTADVADLPAAGPYRLEVVSQQGRRIWESAVAAKDGKISAPVPKRLPRGSNWVRLYSPSGELLREFALKIE